MNLPSKTDADGTPRGKGPAWLGSGAARGRSSPKQAASWHQNRSGPADPDANRNLIRAVVAVFAVGLFAAFAFFLLLRLERTPVIVFRAGEYPRQMPPLAFAQEDAELLGRVNATNLRLVGDEPPLLQSRQSLDQFREALKSAGRQHRFGRGQNAVLVHLAAHGMVNSDGDACLVPSHGDPLDSKTWLKLTDILQALTDEPALKETKKLILLDCQRVLSCWRAGWLENHFDAALPSALSKVNDPNLYVITAAGDDEIAWPAAELRGSVFGHFLAQALQGPDSQRGGSVTLAGLYRTLLEQVDNYALTHRGAHQRPVLWHVGRRVLVDTKGKLVDAGGAATSAPPPADFGIAYVSWFKRKSLETLQAKHDAVAAGAELVGSSPSSSFTSAASAPRSLRYVWQLYANRRSPPAESGQLPAYVTNPVAWADVQQRVAAVGERVFAGEEYQTTAGAEIESLVRDLQNDDKWRPAGALPRLNVTLAERTGPSSRSSRTPARPDSSPAQNLLLEYISRKAEPPKQRELLSAPGINEPRLIHDIHAALAERLPAADARQRLAAAAAMLAQYRQQAPGSETLIEGQFIALLSAGLPAGDSAASLLTTALETRQAAERAATPLDIRVHYAVERLLNQADDRRRQAEDAYYLGIQPQNAERAWRESLGEDNNTNGYRAAEARGSRLAAALALRDEIWAELPLLAEWHLAQAHWSQSPQGAASSQAIEAMLRLLEAQDADRSSGEGLGVFALSRSIERMIQSRDEPATFDNVDGQLQAAADAVEKDWRRAVGEFQRVYEVAVKEVDFRTGEGYRVAESAFCMPPLGVKDGAKELDPFAELMLLAAGSRTPRTAATKGEPAKVADSRRLLRELHRALEYPFDRPYDVHRADDAWAEAESGELNSADEIFGGRKERIARILDEYNKLSAPAEWDSGRTAIAATVGLRQWDARVRVASPWLTLFSDDEKTPARRLQKYDGRHFIAFQAYRALGDYWGTGQSPDAASPGAQTMPFFADAIERCRQALAASEGAAALRYDPPGGEGTVGLADFAAAQPPALAALKEWKAIAFPAGALTSGAGRSRLRVSLEPLLRDGSQAAAMPKGVATLSIRSADGTTPSEQVEFADGQPAEAVPMPISRTSPTTIEARLPAEKSGSSPALAVRLWYRGHVRTAPLPEPGGGQFIEYTVARPNYPPPTILVQGKDTIRGAVLFVFDCSASMQGPNFREAKAQLQRVLTQMQGEGELGGALHVGLMAYGRRTDGASGWYERLKRREDANNLTAAGMQQLGANPRFKELHPHPDDDVETLVSPRTGTAQAVLARLQQLQETECVGVTPLYYAIKSAMDAIRGDSELRVGRIVVISDGVNTPYSCGYDQQARRYIPNPTTLAVNNDDYAALDRALAETAGSISVSVHLFGVQGPGFETLQRQDLERLDQTHPNFQLDAVPNPARLYDSILASFPKSKIELRAAESGTPPQPLAFRVAQPVAGWPGDGLLRRQLDARTVLLQPAGENRQFTQSLWLLGGERVVLDYDGGARDTPLTLAPDGFRDRGGAGAKPPRGEAGRQLIVDAMDPERSGTRVTRLNFRLRDREPRRNFTPRPKYIWLEVKPAGRAADKTASVFPLVDPLWRDNVNLPWLEAPVEGWPDDCQSARVQLWFRDTELGQPVATLDRSSPGKSLTRGSEQWQLEQSGGTAGEPRRITVACRPEGSAASVDTLLRRGVWLWPPPDKTTRRYQRDGALAIHEFTYERPENSPIDVRIVDREQFAADAYAVEFEYSLAN
jgi:hypothetical protein